jgi:hypothetical protein
VATAATPKQLHVGLKAIEKALREATAAERTAIGKYLARRAAKLSVRFKKNGSDAQIALDHPNKLVGRMLVMEALASADDDFVNGILNQLTNASAHSQDINEGGLNFMLSVI